MRCSEEASKKNLPCGGREAESLRQSSKSRITQAAA